MSGDCHGGEDPHYTGGLVGSPSGWEPSDGSCDADCQLVLLTRVRDERGCGQNDVYDCPPQASDDYWLGYLPNTIILHPLSSNVVSNVTIYDYSYWPPKPIGNTVMYYNMNGDVQFDPYVLLDMAAGEVISASVKRFVIGGLKKQFEGLGMTLAGCPECTLLYEGYQIVSNIAAVNNAFTIESHLQTENRYYPTQGLFVPDFPHEYLYRKIK
jgi:hypothetical protein